MSGREKEEGVPGSEFRKEPQVVVCTRGSG